MADKTRHRIVADAHTAKERMLILMAKSGQVEFSLGRDFVSGRLGEKFDYYHAHERMQLLIEQGFVKRRLDKEAGRIAYLYTVTPAGLAEAKRLTGSGTAAARRLRRGQITELARKSATEGQLESFLQGAETGALLTVTFTLNNKPVQIVTIKVVGILRGENLSSITVPSKKRSGG